MIIQLVLEEAENCTTRTYKMIAVEKQLKISYSFFFAIEEPLQQEFIHYVLTT